MGYPGLIKLIPDLHLVTIFITHTRQVKSGKLIKSLNINFSLFNWSTFESKRN